MGWTNFPPIAAQATANSWTWADQIRQAIDEKYKAVNVRFFPLTPHVWAIATITAQGTDARGWYIDFDPAMTCNNFDPSLINTGGVGSRGNVDHFAAVVNDPDPKKCVRLGAMDIGSFPVGHGATSTRLYLTTPPANHPLYLDYAAVVGKELYIITGYGPDADPWWSERCPQPPNDVISARTVTIPTGSPYTCAPGVLIDTTIGARAAAYTGQHLWIGSDRFTITAIDAHSITFANSNVSPLPTLTNGAAYTVIRADGFYKPDNEFYCWKWHDVIDDAYYAHDHTLEDLGPTAGQVGTANLRALTVRVIEPDGGGDCPLIGEPHDITETDVWVALVNWCEDPDTAKTPKLYRTIRGAQLATQAISLNFVKNIDYTGAKAIPLYVDATWFVEAGINVLTLTGTSASWSGTPGSWKVNVTASDFDAFPDGALDDDGVYWALVDTTFGNTVIASGRAYDASDIPADIVIPCEIPRTAAAGGNPLVPQQENVTIDEYQYGTPHTVVWVCSAGWTRKHPAEFRYAYERTGFVPEEYQEEVGDPPVLTNFVADPPTSDHPGTYDTRAASTHLTRPDLRGTMQDSDADYDEIADGMLARYMGDNQNDPGLTETTYFPPAAITRNIVLVVSGDHDDGTLAPRLWYADQFRETLDFQGGTGTSGRATNGGKTFVTDSRQSWWPEGELIVHEGTAADGGATGLTTSASDGFWTQTIDGHGRFVGMAVEVHAGDDVVGDPIWEKRFISFHSGSNISWDEPMSVLTGGRDFKITEPKGRLNYWKGRTITLRSPGGETIYRDVPIIGSDDDTIYFASQETAAGPDWTYIVNEMLIGAVYERADGAWALPAEANGSPLIAKNVHPDTLTRYGYARKRDYVTRTIYAELRAGLDLLSATKGSFGWTDNAESNFRQGDGTGIRTDINDAKDDADAAVATGWAIDPGPSGGTPHVKAGSLILQTGGSGWKVDELIERSYAYPLTTSLPTYLAGDVDLYVYATTADGGFEYSDVVPGLSDDVTFNDYSDPVLYRQWNKFDTQTISDNVTGAQFGSLTQPTDPLPTIPSPDPITGDINGGRSDGYFILAAQGVCRWTMDFHA